MMPTDDPDRETEHVMEEQETAERHQVIVDDELGEEYFYEPPPVSDEPTRRPRRKLITPVALVLGVVTVAALGFIGGVLMQKAQGESGSGSRAAGLPAGFPGAGGGGGQAGNNSGTTTGSVVNKRGKFLYVRNASGNTVRIKTTSNSKVTRTASSKVRAVHPGDTVTIEGTKGRDGTVTAAQITATAKGSTSSGFPPQGFPSGGVPGGAPSAAGGTGGAAVPGG